jgi:hypothetical protein
MGFENAQFQQKTEHTPKRHLVFAKATHAQLTGNTSAAPSREAMPAF